LVSTQLEREVRATAQKFRIAGLMAEGLFVNQEVSLQLAAIGDSPIHNAGIPHPRRSIVGQEIEVPFQRLLGLRQIIGGLSAASAVEQGRRVPPHLKAVDQMNATTQNGRGNYEHSQKNQIEPSHEAIPRASKRLKSYPLTWRSSFG
jgi:hypothetical protein